MIGVGATLNERFTLERELGQGGMGTVYRAVDQVLGRNVAIKLLKGSGTPEVAQQIRLEAQILARFVHNQIVRLYDFGETDGTYFLVMEEVDGSSFSSRWRDLLLGDRLRICGEVAEALEYAHGQGVIHRDVKPGNVLLTTGDQAKLSDFGLSLVDADRKDDSWTITGTPRYMSPEQAQGKPLDHRTDLYSVGVMLYECVTGEVPFLGHPVAVMSHHIHTTPTAPRFRNAEISSTLDNLILSLLEKNPGRRPASGRAVAQALVEEAERARRLERVELGLSPSNGTAKVDPAQFASPSAVEPSTSVIRGPQDVPAAPPLSSLGLLKSTRFGRKPVPAGYDHPVAREMLAEMVSSPILISPDERYLCGHYLAYLLGGSRRRGVFLRRPLDARNSDRARLLLAMSWLSSVEPTEEAIERARLLLEERPDVRAALSPVVVVKYLASRDSPGRRKRFRQVRKRLQEASPYATKAMLDYRGVLNPGMMPGTLDDLAKIAPHRDRIDAHRVSLWNRVTEVWRKDDDFRQAVLRYASQSANLERAGVDLWPEVVYPLIERAHWQRTFRPRHEAIWEYLVGKILRVPLRGVRLDRMMLIAIPVEVAEQFDEDLVAFIDDPQLLEEEAGPSEAQKPSEPRPIYVGSTIPRDEPPAEDDGPRVKVMVPLAAAEPFLFAQDSLRNLWESAIKAQEHVLRPNQVHQTIPVGPYRVAVIPTARGRSAVRAVLQGLHQGKEIEIMTPLLPKGTASKSLIALWLYRDGSAVIAHLDFLSQPRYIFWHATNAHQFNYSYAAELKVGLSTAALEIPDPLERVLTGK